MIKKLLNKLRSGSFWVALVGALTLILSRLGYADAASLTENIVNGVASVLLIFGIAVSPAIGGEGEQTDEDSQTEKSESDDSDDKKQ